MTHVTAQAPMNNKGHHIAGGILRNDRSESVHGKSASKMTVSQTNDKFAELAKAQRNG